MNDDPNYHEVNEFTLGEHWTVASDQGQLAFGQQNGKVILFDGNNRTTISTQQPVTDIDVDQYLLVLSNENIIAYTTSGVELWTQSVPKAIATVGLRGGDVLTVLTDKAQVIGLDLETGRTIFDTSRPHSDLTEIHLTSANGYLYISAWSFVTCFDTKGNIVFDQNLDSKIGDIGYVDNRLIATLKNGSVAALNATTGEHQWQNSASVHHLSPRGQESIPALTDSGSVLVHPEGRITQLAVETGREVISTTDKSILGVANNASVCVYQQGAPLSEQLDCEFLTDNVSTDTPIRISVTNTSDNQIEPGFELVTSQPIELDSQYTETLLAPNESQEIAYRINELPSTSQFEATLMVEDTSITSRSIAVNRQTTPVEAVNVDISHEKISNTTVTVVCTVENSSDMTLDMLYVGDKTKTSITPMEAVTIEQEYPLNGHDQTVVIQIENNNLVETIEREVTIPAYAIKPEIHRVAQDTPCIDVIVQPTEPVQICGDISIKILEDIMVTRELNFEKNENHRIIVILPQSIASRRDIPVQFNSPLLAEDYKTQISGWNQSNVQQKTSDTLSQRQSGQASHNGGHVADKSKKKQVNVERQLPDQITLGARFTESLQITNESERTLTDITVSDSQGQVQLNQIEPTGQVVLQRYHALFDPEEGEFPPVEVGDTCSASYAMDVVTPEIQINAVVSQKNNTGEVTFEITNDSEQQCTVTRAAIDLNPVDDNTIWEFEDSVVVDSNTIETVVRRFDLPDSIDRTTRQILIGYQFNEDHQRRITLAPLLDSKSSSNKPEIEIQLLNNTQFITDTQTVAEIAVKNNSDTPLCDATIAANGAPILQTTLSQQSKIVDELGPGEQETLLVDVIPENHDQESIEIKVEGTFDGESVVDYQTFSGPIGETRDAWEQNRLFDSWAKNTEDKNASIQTELSHLSTPFQPTEEGSPR